MGAPVSQYPGRASTPALLPACNAAPADSGRTKLA